MNEEIEKLIKDDYKWVAKDEDEEIYTYTEIPFTLTDCWGYHDYVKIKKIELTLDLPTNWKESLTRIEDLKFKKESKMKPSEFLKLVADNVDENGIIRGVILNDGEHRFAVTSITMRNGLFTDITFQVGIDDDRLTIVEALEKFKVEVV